VPLAAGTGAGTGAGAGADADAVADEFDSPVVYSSNRLCT